MEHKFKHEQPTSIAAKVGLGMIAMDELSDKEFKAILVEYNQVAPPEAQITGSNLTEQLANVLYLWYYEMKVAPLRTKSLQN